MDLEHEKGAREQLRVLTGEIKALDVLWEKGQSNNYANCVTGRVSTKQIHGMLHGGLTRLLCL